jgi:hypothetical protein
MPLATFHEAASAKVEVSDTALRAKVNTMEFTIHGHTMTGDIVATPHQEEGPINRGFMLRITLENGPYTARR